MCLVHASFTLQRGTYSSGNISSFIKLKVVDIIKVFVNANSADLVTAEYNLASIWLERCFG